MLASLDGRGVVFSGGDGLGEPDVFLLVSEGCVELPGRLVGCSGFQGEERQAAGGCPGFGGCHQLGGYPAPFHPGLGGEAHERSRHNPARACPIRLPLQSRIRHHDLVKDWAGPAIFGAVFGIVFMLYLKVVTLFARRYKRRRRAAGHQEADTSSR